MAAAERDNLLVGRTWPLERGGEGGVEGGQAYRLSREDGTEIFRARVTEI